MLDWALYSEADKRGLLKGEKKALFDEAVKRGLVGGGPKPDVKIETGFESQQSPIDGEPKEKGFTDLGSVVEKAVNIPGFKRSASNIGMVYPVFDAVPQFVSSLYGYPISGLAGLGTLMATRDLEKANKAVNMAQDLTIAKPFTKRGQEVSQALNSPFQALSENIATPAGDFTEKITGSSSAGATVKTAIEAAPAIYGGIKLVYKPNPVTKINKLQFEMDRAIDNGVMKAVKPKNFVKTDSQIRKVLGSARTVVKDMVENKAYIQFKDLDGQIVTNKLPKNLDQFSQSFNQLKSKLFQEYDALARKGGVIEYSPIASELDVIVNSNAHKLFSPATIEYAKSQQEMLKQIGKDTALGTQEAIQLSNESLKSYYANPTPEMAGRAAVDALIANRLRRALHLEIESATGTNYQAIKNKYGAYSEMEQYVSKRAFQDAQKANKGLVDFSDIYTAHELIKGVTSLDPSTFAAGMAAKTIARRIKDINNPNRMVERMFENVEKINSKQTSLRNTIPLAKPKDTMGNTYRPTTINELLR